MKNIFNTTLLKLKLCIDNLRGLFLVKIMNKPSVSLIKIDGWNNIHILLEDKDKKQLYCDKNILSDSYKKISITYTSMQKDIPALLRGIAQCIETTDIKICGSCISKLGNEETI